jgi:hypothetical protein
MEDFPSRHRSSWLVCEVPMHESFHQPKHLLPAKVTVKHHNSEAGISLHESTKLIVTKTEQTVATIDTHPRITHPIKIK